MSQSVAVRFILSGACHPHSGRQVLFDVPLCEEHTVSDMITQVVIPNWPSELPELRSKISVSSIKLLKNGRAVNLQSELRSVFTGDEMRRTLSGDTDSRIESAVLFHLVFTNSECTPEPPSCDRPPSAEPSVERNGTNTVQNRQAKSSDGCCVAM